MKLYIFIFAVILAAIFFAYVIGKKIESAECRANYSIAALEQSNKNSEIKKVINVQVLSVGLGDIRNILREKYTIAE